MKYVYVLDEHLHIRATPGGDTVCGLCHPSQFDWMAKSAFGIGGEFGLVSVSPQIEKTLKNPEKVLDLIQWDSRDSIAGGLRKATPDQLISLWAHTETPAIRIHPAIRGGALFSTYPNWGITPNFLVFLREIYDILRFNDPDDPYRDSRYLEYFALSSPKSFVSRKDRSCYPLFAWAVPGEIDPLRTLIALVDSRHTPTYFWAKAFQKITEYGGIKEGTGEEVLNKALWDTTRKFAIFVRKVWLSSLCPSTKAFQFSPELFFKVEKEAELYKGYIENLNKGG